MNLEHYRLHTRIAVGPDGLSYRGEDARDGRAVEVRVLTSARADIERWPALARRLRLAALLAHPAALAVRDFAPDADPPWVALDWAEPGSFLAHVRTRRPLAPDAAAAIVLPLADLLAATHRLGLTHNALGPAALRFDPLAGVRLDFTGTRTHPPEPAADIPVIADEPASTAGDVFALAALWRWLLGDQPLPPEAQAALDPDPNRRPGAAELAEAIRAEAAPTAATSEIDIPPPPSPPGSDSNLFPQVKPKPIRQTPPGSTLPDLTGRERIGRYRVLNKLGEGGMGAVYRAEDPADGSIVALKVITSGGEKLSNAVRRFRKEARLLAEVSNPFVTRLLDVNEDDGLLYIALEYVAGRDLGAVLAERKTLDERTALTLAGDVARALVDAHRLGVIHRDIKPENVLVTEADGVLRGKLTDFGLARHIDETKSLALTRTGAVVGTPLYMAPEQCAGRQTDARSDVYALGATLFHLLAGRPPFLGDTALAVMKQHADDPPPALRQFNGAVSDAACLVIETALAKEPDRRFPDAAAMLAELDRLLRGEPARLVAHPHKPEAEPGRVWEYAFTWELASPPEKLWPHVSNTERLNRAIGLPAVTFTNKPGGKNGVRRFARARKLGLVLEWEEFPFEWVEGRRMGVLRRFSRGPVKWFVSAVDLAPRPGGGTTLTHRIAIEPAGFVGRRIVGFDMRFITRNGLDKVYRRIDAAAIGADSSDPFEEAVAVSGPRRRRLDQLVEAVIGRGTDAATVRALGEYVARAPDQEVSRIRPIALAERLGLSAPRLVEACLHGAREGLLVLLWDVLCPVCRIPSEMKESLRELQDHGRCEACQLDYDLDFDQSVELVFRAHPELRDAEARTYCVGGPAHSPHVAAQVRLAAGERFAADLALPEGAYRLRGPQLPFNLDFRVRPGAAASGWELHLSRGAADRPPDFRPGHQRFILNNDFDREAVVRVERTAPRGDALTAARAAALAVFRELFPREILAPGLLIRVSTATLLATDLDGAEALYRDLGDAAAFSRVHEYLRVTGECVRLHGGTVVKAVGDGVLAAFSEASTAVAAALDLQPTLAKTAATAGLKVRVGVHRGPVMATTVNDRLDYFGRAVKAVLGLLPRAAGGEVLATEPVALDPVVAELLSARNVDAEVLDDSGGTHRLRS